MRHTLRKTVGLTIAFGAALLFCLATGNLNKPQRLGNLMSGAMSAFESISLTAIIDASAVLLAFGAVKLAALPKKPIGLSLIAVSFVCLGFGIYNYLDAPPFGGGGNETDKIPVANTLHVIVGGISAIILLAGIWLFRSQDQTNEKQKAES